MLARTCKIFPLRAINNRSIGSLGQLTRSAEQNVPLARFERSLNPYSKKDWAPQRVRGRESGEICGDGEIPISNYSCPPQTGVGGVSIPKAWEA
jgi:hypothetical protein